MLDQSLHHTQLALAKTVSTVEAKAVQLDTLTSQNAALNESHSKLKENTVKVEHECSRLRIANTQLEQDNVNIQLLNEEQSTTLAQNQKLLTEALAQLDDLKSIDMHRANANQNPVNE